MDTFKQYYTKIINEMGWNPQVRMKQPGDPSRLREQPRAVAGGGGEDGGALAQAKAITDNPGAVDLQHAQQVLDDLGKSFEASPENLKNSIIQKYRELRDLLKQKSATPVTQENVIAVTEECVRIAESIDRLLTN